MPNAVVLLSGGLDSTTTLAIAQAEGFTPYALSFRYGQRHLVELESAQRVASVMGVAEHLIADIDLRRFGGSALTADIPVPKDQPLATMAAGIPITYVPARNTIFLSFALAWAEVLEASDLFIGVNALDYSGYPDCRLERPGPGRSAPSATPSFGVPTGEGAAGLPALNLEGLGRRGKGSLPLTYYSHGVFHAFAETAPRCLSVWRPSLLCRLLWALSGCGPIAAYGRGPDAVAVRGLCPEALRLLAADLAPLHPARPSRSRDGIGALAGLESRPRGSRRARGRSGQCGVCRPLQNRRPGPPAA